MNFTNTNTTKEGFYIGFSDAAAVSKTEAKVRPILDSLAFYNNPGDLSDGEQLCKIFQQLRVNMAQTIIGEQKNSNAMAAATAVQSSGGNMNDVFAAATTANNASVNSTNAEVSQQVEQILQNAIPGGALPCPLLNYPQPGSSDIQWITFLYSIPDDFGARVVLMALYADKTIADSSGQLDKAINMKTTDLSPAPASEAFIDICPTDLAAKKREDMKEQTCTLPESLDPAQYEMAISEKIDRLMKTKDRILMSNISDPVIAQYASLTIHPQIVSVQAKLLKLDQQKAQIQQIMTMGEISSPASS